MSDDEVSPVPEADHTDSTDDDEVDEQGHEARGTPDDLDEFLREENAASSLDQPSDGTS